MSALTAATICLSALTAHGASPGAPANGYLPMIMPSPGFTLSDVKGYRVGLTDLRGKITLMTFMYTHCTTMCPLVAVRLSGIAAALGNSRWRDDSVRIVSVTIDPARDTAGWLAKYGKSIGADDAHWMFLTGSTAETQRLLDAYDFYARRGPTGDFDHVSRIYLLDAQGQVRQIYSSNFLETDAVLHDIDSLLAEKSDDQRLTRRR
jgi:protein SCO1/2